MGCSAEITSQGGYGAEIDLDQVNVAVEGMPPEVIAVGETQERLLWVVPPEIVPEILRIYNEVFTLPEVAYNARAVVIGRVTAERRYVMRYHGNVVMDVESDFLTGAIRDELPYTEVIHHAGPSTSCRRSTSRRSSRRCSRIATCARASRSIAATMRSCAARPCCRAALADAGVLAPIAGSRLGVALAVAGNPRYGRIDPGYAAEHAVLEAMRRVVAVGARPIGLDRLPELRQSAQARSVRRVRRGGRRAGARRALQLDLAVRLRQRQPLQRIGRREERSRPRRSSRASARSTNVGAVVTPGFKARGIDAAMDGQPRARRGWLRAGGSCSVSTAPCRDLSYGAERAAVGNRTRRDRARRLRSCRAVADGGMLTALARLAFDAMLRGRNDWRRDRLRQSAVRSRRILCAK